MCLNGHKPYYPTLMKFKFNYNEYLRRFMPKDVHMVVPEKTVTPENKLNQNFDKAEFQAL